jgi:predicted  nucleic acid-binding Zn-ribbon protein
MGFIFMRISRHHRAFSAFSDKDDGKAIVKFSLRAICTGFVCTKIKKPDMYSAGVVKKMAKKTDIFCPDCGFALYWDRQQLGVKNDTE